MKDAKRRTYSRMGNEKSGFNIFLYCSLQKAQSRKVFQEILKIKKAPNFHLGQMWKERDLNPRYPCRGTRP